MRGSRFARTSICLSLCLKQDNSKRCRRVSVKLCGSMVLDWVSTDYSSVSSLISWKPVISPGLFEVLVMLQSVRRIGLHSEQGKYRLISVRQLYGCCVGDGWSDFPRRRVEGRLPHSHRVGEHDSREVDGKRDWLSPANSGTRHRRTL